MVLQSNLKYVDYLKLINTTSDQLSDSIENQLELINKISSLLDDTVQDFSDTLVMGSGKVFSIDKTENDISFVLRSADVSSDEILSTYTLSLSELEMSSIVGQVDEIPITLAQLIAEAGQSYRLNQVIYNWCETIKAQQTMMKSQAQVIINTIYNGNTSDISYTQLQLVLTQMPENITFQNFSQLLNIIYSPLKDIEREQSLELRSSVTIVKSFIGTSILQLISSVGQVISLILTAVSKVLGLLLSIFISIFSWLLGISGVTTKAQLNVDSGNWFNTDPLLAFICPADDFPEISQLIVSGGPALQLTLPGITVFIWKVFDKEANSDKIYVNGYLDLNINPVKFCQYAHDNFKNAIIEYVNDSSCIVKEDGLANIINVQDLDVCMQPSDYFTYSNDDNFWAFACALNYTLYRLSYCTNSATNVISSEFSVGRDNDQDKWSNLLIMISKEINLGMGNGINGDYTEYWKYIASLSEYSISREYSKDITIGNTNQYMRVPVAGYTDYQVNYYSGFLTLITNLTMNNGINTIGNMIKGATQIGYSSQTPKSFFLKYPEYTNDAIVKSVLFIGSIVALGAATVKAVQIAFKPRYASWSQNKLTTLNELRNRASTTNSKADWRKYNRQATWYNAVASIFGDGAYDPNTGFVNYNTNSNNSSIIGTYTSQVENSELSREILNSIK